ncbi:MAG TPA: hypothetical protein VII99_00655, partial [Bacteroidia bacterium]
MKKIVLAAIVMLNFQNSFSQKTCKQNMREGDEYFFSNDYAGARRFYAAAWKLDSSDAKLAFRLGVSMFNLRRYRLQSLPYFEKALKGNNTETKFYLGNLYHLNGKFQEAIEMYSEYMNAKDRKENEVEIKKLIEKSKTAIEMTAHPANVKIENMGPVINSEYADYVPVISADETELIFTSRRAGSTGGQLDPNGEFFEDIYISNKINGEWSAPTGIRSLNTPTHDACVGLSPDGDLLFLYKPSKDLLTGDLYVSVFSGGEWATPVKLDSPINQDNCIESSASLAADGNTLYFSSDRPGGYGKRDIYRVTKLSNGEWSKPMNLGPTINTPEDEDAPFIHPDGKILYFSSKGHKNMGGYDVFRSTLNAEDGKWSEPENLGYPINTPDDDIFFVLSVDGKRGFFSSARLGGYGESDLYVVNFPDEDLRLTPFKYAVVSEDSLLPVHAKITLTDMVTNKVAGIYTTNPKTGKFLMILNPDRKYSMLVESVFGKYSSVTEVVSPGR